MSSNHGVHTEPGWYWYRDGDGGCAEIVELRTGLGGILHVRCSSGRQEQASRLMGAWGPRIPDWTPPPEPETVSEVELNDLIYGARMKGTEPLILCALEELLRRRAADKERGEK